MLEFAVVTRIENEKVEELKNCRKDWGPAAGEIRYRFSLLSVRSRGEKKREKKAEELEGLRSGGKKREKEGRRD